MAALDVSRVEPLRKSTPFFDIIDDFMIVISL
jgi:hypothetical protein